MSIHRCAPDSLEFPKRGPSGPLGLSHIGPSRCVDVGVLFKVGTQPFGNSAEEDLCLDTQQGDDAELV